MLLMVVVAVFLAETSQGFNESDLVALETSCHPVDPCRRDSLPPPSWRGRNCFCDERCLRYADCCIDADAYDAQTYQANVGRFTCVNLKQYGDVYMKGTCSDGWEDREVAALCLGGSPAANLGHEDLLANLPATSADSNVTYVNYYCAICNNDSLSLTLWQSRWECEGLDGLRSTLSQDAAASGIAFKDGNWGVEVEINGTKEYHVCAMYPSLPTTLTGVTRPCQAAISSCAANWTDQNVADLCQSYTAVVYNNTLPYRNPHCATCNYLEKEKTSCLSRDLQRNKKDRFFNPEAFALLFDFTDASGSNVVGSTSPCSRFEVWDPFFRKCRSVVCAKENQKFERGKCVDVSDFNATTTSEPSTAAATTPKPVNTPSANRNIPIIFPDDPAYSTAPPITSPPPPTTTMPTPTNTTVLSNTPDMLSAGAIIIKLLGKVNVDYEFYKERATRLVPADDDSWLQITPDALDDMLENKFGSANGNEQPRPADDTEVMNSLSAFLGHMSDLDGAEVPQDLQERIRKLSTLSTSRKASKARKPSSLMVHPQVRKISAQSNASDSSNSSEMSSLSNKVDFNAESFTEAITNILEFGVPEDDYWNQSEDESSGMSSYGEEDAGDGSLSRKSSNTSQKSAASTVSATSSGVDLQMKEYLREMERELAATTLRDSLASQHNGNDDEADDEFDDVEDFEPVKVDMQAVQDLVKTYTAQNGLPGPASSLLGSMGIKPEKK